MVKKEIILAICKKCKASCCRLGGPFLTQSEKLAIIREGYPDFFNKLSDKIYEVKSKKGICPYLCKDNSCSIHKVRPLICKCWPIFPQFKEGRYKESIITCPITHLLSKKQISDMQTQAKNVPSFLINYEEAFKLTKLSSSDIKLIERRLHQFKIKEIK